MCWDRIFIEGNIIAFSTVQVSTDVVFSCFPLTFIVRLNQSLRERVVLSILMGLGLFASATAILRTAIGVSVSKDQFKTGAEISLLALVDLHVGIIAATLPTPKSFFEGLLVRIVNWPKDRKSEEEVRTIMYKMGLLDTLYASEPEPELESEPKPELADLAAPQVKEKGVMFFGVRS